MNLATASFAAPSCGVIPGPIDQNSAAANTKTTRHNPQVITNQSGNIVFIPTPYVGSVHDLMALRDTLYKAVFSEAVGGPAGPA